ncbi:hypothetical protein B0O99DRAFT_600617 [Bisporella sp. PMI_857]|nr:hypothetical protein B0O99DRAFT_600617 [Bisporella sp. PMI_857]
MIMESDGRSSDGAGRDNDNAPEGEKSSALRKLLLAAMVRSTVIEDGHYGRSPLEPHFRTEPDDRRQPTPMHGNPAAEPLSSIGGIGVHAPSTASSGHSDELPSRESTNIKQAPPLVGSKSKRGSSLTEANVLGAELGRESRSPSAGPGEGESSTRSKGSGGGEGKEEVR